ncbi:unnamed protein product [Sphacelaria rigidula]
MYVFYRCPAQPRDCYLRRQIDPGRPVSLSTPLVSLPLPPSVPLSLCEGTMTVSFSRLVYPVFFLPSCFNMVNGDGERSAYNIKWPAYCMNSCVIPASTTAACESIQSALKLPFDQYG